jgi:hypothetical protein
MATMLTLFLLSAACDRGPEDDPIVGRWRADGTTAYSEYFPDGTALINNGRMSISVKWMRLEDERLKIDSTLFGVNTAAIYKVTIDGDNLTFTSEEGTVEHYHREEPQ